MAKPLRIRNGNLARLLFVILSASSVFGQSTWAPKLIHGPLPDYSAAARREKIQGTVVVELDVGTDGLPHNLKIVKGLRADLDQSALEAVKKWRFKPAMKDGTPMQVSIRTDVNFSLYSH